MCEFIVSEWAFSLLIQLKAIRAGEEGVARETFVEIGEILTS